VQFGQTRIDLIKGEWRCHAVPYVELKLKQALQIDPNRGIETERLPYTTLADQTHGRHQCLCAWEGPQHAQNSKDDIMLILKSAIGENRNWQTIFLGKSPIIRPQLIDLGP
jgi:hypothetical protein